jgi:mannitol-1-phosphate 5-dehydrogenase
MGREKIVVFGAGATGRGHVGLLAWQAGHEIVFVERRTEIVQPLREAGRYTVNLCGRGASRVDVSGFRIFDSRNRRAVAEEIAGARLVLTAVLAQNLEDVSETLAMAVAAHRRQRRTLPVNCIACENMMDSSSILGRFVEARLSSGNQAYSRQHFGFPDCMISRVVPQPEGDPLVLIAENHNEWTVRREEFKGPKLALDAMDLVDNQTARLERKLLIHNGGHAVCGYLAFHRGIRYIHEAVADPAVAECAGGALKEMGEVVRRKHGFSAEDIAAYIENFIERGSIPEMRDEVLRVVRDPIRKLSPRERLVAPALLAVEYSLPRNWIVKGIVAALRYRHPDDAQSLQLAAEIQSKGLTSVLHDTCGIPSDSPLIGEIQSEWDDWDKS